MKFESKYGWLVANTVAIIWALVQLITTTYVQYDLHRKGQEPERRLKITHTTLSSVLSDIKPLSLNGDVALQFGDKRLTNLFVSNATIFNPGKTPIEVSNIETPLSVEVGHPWEIIAVSNTDQYDSNVNLVWQRINTQKFFAKPALLNPKDITSITLYLSNEKIPSFSSTISIDEPKIVWDARITNLAEIDRGDKAVKEVFNNAWDEISSFYVLLTGYKFIFTCVVGILNLTLILYLLGRSGIITSYNLRLISLCVFGGVLSISSAECMGTYIYGDIIFETLSKISSHMSADSYDAPVNHYFNAPPIVVNVIMILYLIFRGWKSRARQLSAELSWTNP